MKTRPPVTRPRIAALPRIGRNLWLALAVLVLHGGLIWILQNGLLIRAAEMLVPAEVLSELAPPPAPPQARQTPTTQAIPVAAATPRPAEASASPPPPAVTSPSPQAAEASINTAAAPAAPAPSQAMSAQPANVSSSAPSSVSSTQLVLPSSSADYLQNPKPPYPPLSARLGETGRTVYKVWIGTDGKAQRAELVTSSGFPRLDKAAYDTVMGWRYTPGKRGGVPELMPFNVPIHWELRN